MNNPDPLYAFAFRGILADEALDIAGRKHKRHSVALDEEYLRILSIDLLDDDLVAAARLMATVYTSVAAFENSVRKLIATVLLEQVGADWWNSSVSEKIRTRSESRRVEEERIKWHTQRGADPIAYSQMGDLVAIIRQNWPHFEPYFPSIEWVASIVDVLERSKNVIMHSGQLERADVERIGIYIRDWISKWVAKQKCDRGALATANLARRRITSVAADKGREVRCVTAQRFALLRSQLIYWSLCSRTRRYTDNNTDRKTLRISWPRIKK